MSLMLTRRTLADLWERKRAERTEGVRQGLRRATRPALWKRPGAPFEGLQTSKICLR